MGGRSVDSLGTPANFPALFRDPRAQWQLAATVVRLVEVQLRQGGRVEGSVSRRVLQRVPMNFLLISAICAGLALIFAVLTFMKIMRLSPGEPRMVEISKLVQEGAAAFLKAEYKWLALFVVVVGGVIAMSSAELGLGPKTALAFVCGASFSALAGYFGMHCSTRAAVPARRCAGFARVRCGWNRWNHGLCSAPWLS